MTEEPLDNTPGDGSGGDAPVQPRHTSVRLREDGTAQEAALMDPANQSLADALKITFYLLQGAMVVLAGLFVFSGFQTVREGESGISVLFGRAVKTNLDPGFHFAAPYPLGELVKVDTGNVAEELKRSFWPAVSDKNLDDSIERLPSRAQLDPERDGSLITADLNIAHTQWQAVYRRVNPVKYANNILPAHEESIVRSALERGVVRTMAAITIDELLKPQEGGTRAIAERAREIAQETLDALDSGINIEQFELGRRTPPAQLLNKFRAVLDARSEAQKAITEARGQRDTELNEAAGEASGVLLWLISRYEVAIETHDSGESEKILASIDTILEGDPIAIDNGIDEEASGMLGYASGKTASGDVVKIIQNAKVDRLAIVQEARADLEFFKAKQGQFLANPDLMIRRDWAAAWTAFQAQDFVQTMQLPAGPRVELRINEDPEILKGLDRAQKQRDRIRVAKERERKIREGQYKIDRSTLIEDR